MKFKFMGKAMIMFVAIMLVAFVSLETVSADAFKVVTLGADLSKDQKDEMLKYFQVDRREANVLEVNKQEEDKYLGKVASKKQIGTKSISCSYVEPTDKGGLNISTHNIYWVTDSMIRNALITAGVENANVKVGAPFNVSGTAALTGILKGFENSKSGKKIDEKKKKAANEEVIVTGNIGEKIGQDEAANLINDVKKDIIKSKPKNEKEVENIVINITNSFNKNSEKTLSKEDVKNITSLMNKINALDLNFKQLKDQLNGVTKQLKDKLTSDEAQGFFKKIWIAIRNFFDKLFSTEDGNGNAVKTEVKDDSSKVENKDTDNTKK